MNRLLAVFIAAAVALLYLLLSRLMGGGMPWDWLRALFRRRSVAGPTRSSSRNCGVICFDTGAVGDEHTCASTRMRARSHNPKSENQNMKRNRLLASFVVAMLAAHLQLAAVRAVTFGTGANAFNIDFANIGNAGNGDDLAAC